jgi:hypothetical protein
MAKAVKEERETRLELATSSLGSKTSHSRNIPVFSRDIGILAPLASFATHCKHMRVIAGNGGIRTRMGVITPVHFVGFQAE